MNKFPSIFNDVIGPVMSGPSSSHTAGPTRIGKLARQFAENDLLKVEVHFDANGSFAGTYKGQRSDKGLAGGLLGWEPEDVRMVNALDEAVVKGMDIKFYISEFDAPHPNTMKLYITDKNNKKISVTGLSVGGGMVELIEFNGYSISIEGDYFEIILVIPSNIDNCSNLISKLLKENHINAEYINVISNNEGTLINVKLSMRADDKVLMELKNTFSAKYVKQIEPVLPILSRENIEIPFITSDEILKHAEKENMDLFQTALFYECRRGGISKEEAIGKMEYILGVMKDSIEKGISQKGKMPYILQHQAYKVKEANEAHRLLDLGILNKIIYSSMACMETSSSMGVIAAAPTAGSCGIIPGTLVSICEELSLSDLKCVEALFCSGLIGILIAYSATFSAETCGCQAECGSASSMAAAGIVYLAGGTIKQSITAASIALQNVLGLVCDPVAGLAEIPCMTRNIMAVSNAVSCANMALAGVDEIIPLDEVIKSMYSIGEILPRELRCTCLGGLATTKTGSEFSNKLKNIKY